MSSVELNADNLAGYDCVVIATDHSSYDYQAPRSWWWIRGTPRAASPETTTKWSSAEGSTHASIAGSVDTLLSG
jgi:hypothetical protein